MLDVDRQSKRRGETAAVEDLTFSVNLRETAIRRRALREL